MTSLTRVDNRVIIECIDPESAGHWFERIAKILDEQQQEQERKSAIINEKDE